MRRGFTLIEVMIVVAIIGALASLSIPAVYWARVKAEEKVCARNIVEVEKAKATLTLPADSVKGAVGLENPEIDFSSGDARHNLLMAMSISDLADLRVGGRDIQVGTLKDKACYQ
jgi:prepilin-type N-terminal cleavage/methylation domain-containing protein